MFHCPSQCLTSIQIVTIQVKINCTLRSIHVMCNAFELTVLERTRKEKLSLHYKHVHKKKSSETYFGKVSFRKVYFMVFGIDEQKNKNNKTNE